MSIHTCLPGMECIARPPGSETRAWGDRNELLFIVLYIVYKIQSHDLNIPESLGV